MTGRFRLSVAGQLPADVPAARLTDRRSLLDRFDRARAAADRQIAAGGFDKFRAMAFSLATSNRVRDALDVTREPLLVRERYGDTLFGQSCLCARRLVEAGCKFVTVFWDGYGQFSGCAWDTHANHYPRLKEYLLPGFDLAYPALLLDLEARGLLDETLVVWGGEFGRTPMIEGRNNSKFLGRDHHPRAFTMWLAGGGVRRGVVVGATDELGYNAVEDPCDVHDLHATLLHLMGLDHTKLTYRHQGRPFRLTDVSGKLIAGLI
jgi:uncharacterized protein (DUF1501 family)